MNQDILKKDGLSIEKLEQLSYQSKLGIRLKKNLHYFDKNTLFTELEGINEWYDSCEFLHDIVTDYRVKSIQSAYLKYSRYYPDHQAGKVFNDMLGFRALCDNYEDVLNLSDCDKIRVADMSQGKAHDDGYRGIHLIYKYVNTINPDYDGLSLELQIRTRLQHAWATAVETMGTFLGQALKSGQGEEQWREFFSIAGAALADLEKTTPVPGFESCGSRDIHERLFDAERRLRVLEKLSGFAIAADRITTERGQGGYHLITLDSSQRTVTIRPFPMAKLEEANLAYAAIEARTKVGEPVEAVLVSAGPVESLRKAYPNYFLDTQVFVRQLQRLIALHKPSKKA